MIQGVPGTIQTQPTTTNTISNLTENNLTLIIPQSAEKKVEGSSRKRFKPGETAVDTTLTINQPTSVAITMMTEPTTDTGSISPNYNPVQPGTSGAQHHDVRKNESK